MSKYSIGEIIWCKLPDYPYWPAKVVDEKDPIVTKNIIEDKEDRDCLCQFFYTDDFSWFKIEDGSTMLFSKDPEMMDGNVDRDLKKAITLAKKEFFQENEKKRKIQEINTEEEVQKKKKYEKKEIDEIQKKLEKEIKNKDVEKVIEILKLLKDVEISVSILKETKIVALIKNLKKKDQQDEVKKDQRVVDLSNDLFNEWKKLVPEPKKEEKVKVENVKKEVKKEVKKDVKKEDKKNSQDSQNESTPTKLTNIVDEILPKTNDKLRDYWIKKLYSSLNLYCQDQQQCIDYSQIIEDSVFSFFKSSNDSDYKNQLRNINFNLSDKKNQRFRGLVLDGKLNPNQFPKLQPIEMASEEELQKLDKLESERIHEMVSATQSATTDLFKCGKCKQSKCSYFQLQTRSADEPMTTFIQCHHCGNRWKQ